MPPCFAEHGSKGATMRAIADRAGVSLGLVQHHFGTKAGLLEACDAYVLAFVREQITRAVDEKQLTEPAYVAEAHRLGPPVLRRHASLTAVLAAVFGSDLAAGLLLAGGLFAGLAYGPATHDLGGELPALLGSALMWLPAVWVVGAIALALQGFLPKLATAVSWALLVLFLLLELAFEFGQVSQALLDLSPFTHIPRVLLGVPFTPGPIVVLLVLAGALVAAGQAGIRRRDVG
jgi:putative exporter of polyketide antibiotics